MSPLNTKIPQRCLLKLLYILCYLPKKISHTPMDLSTTRVLIKSAYYKKFKQYREVPRRKQKKKNHFKMPHSKSAIINIR